MRDCENCKHRVMKVEVGKGTSPEHFWGCECWECEFEPTTKNDLGVDREDAVERLNALKQFIGYDKDSEIVKATQKSLDMAISALEHPERNVVAIVPCGDAISRKAALNQIFYSTDNSGDVVLGSALRERIARLPSVTPQEPKTGHWIEHPHEAGPCWEYSRYECSECHDWAEDDSDYCPNCGAKMVEPQESEDKE